MDDPAVVGGRAFGLRPWGYSRSAVDRHLREVAAARATLEAEVARLAPAEPLTRVGEDVVSLLRSFAQAVRSMREEAAAQADRVRAEAEAHAKKVRDAADAYADRRRAEVDHLVTQAEEQARKTAAAIIDNARGEVAQLLREQMTIGEALDRAALGIEASRTALGWLSRREQGDGPPSRRPSLVPSPVAAPAGPSAADG